MKTGTGGVRLQIEGMHCASCVSRVEKALMRLDGVEAAAVNLATESATVHSSIDVAADSMIEAVESAGFGARLEEQNRDSIERQAEADRQAAEQLQRRAITSGVLAVIVMVMSMAPMVVSSWPIELEATHWIAWLLTSVVVFWGGRSFFTGALQQLKHRSSDMNTLVALGAGSAWLYSSVVVFAPQAFVGLDARPYFDSAAMIIAFLLVGRSLEARARRRTGDAMRALLEQNAPTACVLRDGEEVTVDSAELSEGDLILVRPGERIAADGTIHEGRASVDESMLTGENAAVVREAGEKVYAATVNMDGRLVVRADSVGSGTVFARIVRLVEEAQASKAPIQRVVDRIAAVFVPVVIVIAFLTLFIWLFLVQRGIEVALLHFVTVLIIACPCAMGLATPAAILVGTGRGAERGILVRNGSVFEVLRSIDTVVFDKTGTLTQGKHQVVAHDAVSLSSDELLMAAAAVERSSEHSLARGVIDAALGRGLSIASAVNFEAVAGRGVMATVEGRRWYVGSARWFAEREVDLTPIVSQVTEQEQQGRTVLHVGVDESIAGWIAMADTQRKTSAHAVRDLESLGCEVVLLTGDRVSAAKPIADLLGIENLKAEVLPDQKAEVIAAMQRDGHAVIMVGDGINDAVALAQAEVGIAMGGGADVAVEAGSVTLLRDDPADVAQAIRLGRATVRAIHQNLFWAFAYNTLGIPIAAGVLAPLGIVLHPAFAAAAMALSSLSVLTNSLRLRKSI